MPSQDRIGELRWIQTDSNEPERLAGFWGAVFGVEVEARLGEPAQFVTLAPVAPGVPRVSFQRVSEPKRVKNRLHFDVWVADVEEACRKVEALGGKRRDSDDSHEHGYSWRRMSDPEGHEFCLVYDAPGPT